MVITESMGFKHAKKPNITFMNGQFLHKNRYQRLITSELSQISDCTDGRGEALRCMDMAEPFQSHRRLVAPRQSF